MKLNNQTIVSTVAAICLFGLVVVLKNLLHVPGDVLSRDVLLYIIIYSAFGILYPGQSEAARKSRWDHPLYWSLMVVLVTAAIIIVNAL